jgi:hypothetical protein
MRTPNHCKLCLIATIRITIAFSFTVFSFHFSAAQKRHRPDSLMLYYQQIKFIVHAPELLPRLAEQKQWAEMKNFLDNWSDAESSSRELIFSLETLLAIETHSALLQPPCDVLLYLADYSKELKNTINHNDKFKYFIQLPLRNRYDATGNAERVLVFTRSWARQLLQAGHLNGTELFLCRAFAGETDDPVSYYQSNPAVYPALLNLQEMIAVANDKYFVARRNGHALVTAVMTGDWTPTSHLMVLGTHPSIGFQLGVRNKLNEYDVVYNYRFLNTPGKYMIVRNDSSVASNYYDGGYIGLEYTRYFIHHKYLDVGFTSGLGYDYFDVTDESKNDHPDFSYSPATVGSLVFNNGIRVKYFFRKQYFLGLTAKYSLMHYPNTGGTNLTGNAFSVDLVFGSH